MSVIIANAVQQCCNITPGVGCGPAIPVSTGLVLVYPGQTVVVDSIDTTNFLGVKWLVDLTATNALNRRNQAYEVYATHRYGRQVPVPRLQNLLPPPRACR